MKEYPKMYQVEFSTKAGERIRAKVVSNNWHRAIERCKSSYEIHRDEKFTIQIIGEVVQ